MKTVSASHKITTADSICLTRPSSSNFTASNSNKNTCSPIKSEEDCKKRSRRYYWVRSDSPSKEAQINANQQNQRQSSSFPLIRPVTRPDERERHVPFVHVSDDIEVQHPVAGKILTPSSLEALAAIQASVPHTTSDHHMSLGLHEHQQSGLTSRRYSETQDQNMSTIHQDLSQRESQLAIQRDQVPNTNPALMQYQSLSEHQSDWITTDGLSYPVSSHSSPQKHTQIDPIIENAIVSPAHQPITALSPYFTQHQSPNMSHISHEPAMKPRYDINHLLLPAVQPSLNIYASNPPSARPLRVSRRPEPQPGPMQTSSSPTKRQRYSIDSFLDPEMIQMSRNAQSSPEHASSSLSHHLPGVLEHTKILNTFHPDDHTQVDDTNVQSAEMTAKDFDRIFSFELPELKLSSYTQDTPQAGPFDAETGMHESQAADDHQRPRTAVKSPRYKMPVFDVRALTPAFNIYATPQRTVNQFANVQPTIVDNLEDSIQMQEWHHE